MGAICSRREWLRFGTVALGGVDPRTLIRDAKGGTYPLSEGRPIAQLRG